MAAANPGAGPGPGAGLDGLLVRRKRAWQDAQAAWVRVQTRQEQSGQARAAAQRELLTVSPFARLYARCASMPVIEQAKGILMAQQGCGEDDAFDLLRRASQRSNMRVRDLAAQIVHSAQSRR